MTSKYIAGLQDPFKDKYIKGKSNNKIPPPRPLVGLTITFTYWIKTVQVGHPYIYLKE